MSAIWYQAERLYRERFHVQQCLTGDMPTLIRALADGDTARSVARTEGIGREVGAMHPRDHAPVSPSASAPPTRLPDAASHRPPSPSTGMRPAAPSDAGTNGYPRPRHPSHERAGGTSVVEPLLREGRPASAPSHTNGGGRASIPAHAPSSSQERL